MLNDEDIETVKYLRNSQNDALKREAAYLIERLNLENMMLKRKIRVAVAELSEW